MDAPENEFLIEELDWNDFHGCIYFKNVSLHQEDLGSWHVDLLIGKSLLNWLQAN